MNYKEITDLIKLINKSDLSEFKMRDKDFHLSIRTGSYTKQGPQIVHNMPAPAVQAMPQAPAPAASAPQEASPSSNNSDATAKAEEKEGLVEVRSPIVGTFYRSSSPDKPPFVKVGDTIEKGSVVCIVEAMKLFNEIESEVSGTIVKVMVEDALPVEYDQVLFLVDPS